MKEKEAAEAAVQKERQLLIEATKFTLRKFLKDDYDCYTQRGWCSVQEKEEVDALYRLYHEGFNGNGTGTRYYEAIIALPTNDHDSI